MPTTTYTTNSGIASVTFTTSDSTVDITDNVSSMTITTITEAVPVKEAARILGVSKQRVYALIRSGALDTTPGDGPPVRGGGPPLLVTAESLSARLRATRGALPAGYATPAEAADELDVSLSTVYLYLRTGLLKSDTIDGRTLIPTESIASCVRPRRGRPRS